MARKKAAKKSSKKAEKKADEQTDVQKFNPGSGPDTYPAEDANPEGSLADRDITDFNPGSGDATWPAGGGGATTTAKLPKSAKK